MSDLEGEAATVIHELSTNRSASVEGEQREILGFFIAMQWSRHRFLLNLLRSKTLEDNPVDSSDPAYEYATRSLGLSHVLLHVLEPWAARNDPDASYKDQWRHIPSILATWSWAVFRPRTDALIISDNLVCLSGLATGANTQVPPAWTQHGVGIGFENCRRVTVPLGRRLGLLIAREPKDTKNITSQSFNRWTVYNSREFMAYAPGWQNQQPMLYGKVIEDLHTQRIVIPWFLAGATL
jgi:Protein of unknown function (DUF4238)